MKHQILSIACLLGLAAQASAQTVVLDTYGPGNTTDGWPSLVYQDGTGRQDVAIPFSLSTATDVQSILSSLEGVGGVTFGILARVGATPAGNAWLYSTHLVDPSANALLNPSGWTLAAGNYWLAAVADAGFSGTWQSGTEDYSANWAVTNNAGAWTEVTSTFIGTPAARITVSAVPEPSSYALLIAGGLLLAAARTRKQGGQA